MHLLEQNLLPFFPAKTPPSFPTIVWLNFSQEHIRLPLSCKQTSSLLPIGWRDTSPLPFIQSDSHNSALQRGGRRGGVFLKGEGGEGRWWQKQVGRKSEWRGRVNSHVTGSSCSVDGKREIQQPQKGMMDVVFIKTPPGRFQQRLSQRWQAR